MEGAGEKGAGAFAGWSRHLVYTPASPSVYRRIDIAKFPFVGGDLPVGVHIPIAQEKQQLLFGKMGVKAGKKQHVEGAVPSGVPRVFPLVGHGDEVAVKEMPPVQVAFLSARCGAAFVFFPVGYEVVIELFAPQ